MFYYKECQNVTTEKVMPVIFRINDLTPRGNFAEHLLDRLKDVQNEMISLVDAESNRKWSGRQMSQAILIVAHQ